MNRIPEVFVALTQGINCQPLCVPFYVYHKVSPSPSLPLAPSRPRTLAIFSGV